MSSGSLKRKVSGEKQLKVKLLSIHTRMIPAKCVYILSLGAIGSYVPYLNIFLISIGLTTSQAGIISGVRFLSAPISTALLGTLIDYTGHRKRIFIGLCLGSSLPIFSMPWVASALSHKIYNRTGSGSTSVQNITEQLLYTDFTHHTHILRVSEYLFYIILGIMILSGFFSVPLAGFIDSVVMNVIKTGRQKTSFGGQRMVGSLSFMVTNFVAGVCADYYSRSHTLVSHYAPIFYLFIIQMLLLIPAGLFLLNQANWSATLQVDEEGQQSEEQLSSCAFFVSLFKSSESVIFLVSVFISGLSYNLFFGYVYLFMRDEMKVSDSLMTLTVVCSTLSEILTFPFTSKLIRWMGDTSLSIMVGIFSYFLRFIVMSYFTNMWVIIPIQLLHGLGFSLSWAAQIEYVQTNTPTVSKVTMFSILTTVHFAVGAILANVIGGEVYSVFGGRKLFLGTGVICVLWTGVMLLHYKLKKYRGKSAKYQVEGSNNNENGCVNGRAVEDVLNRNQPYTIHCSTVKPV